MKFAWREYLTRNRLMAITLQLCFLALAVRLIAIQAVQHEFWSAHADRMSSGVKTLPAQRGQVLDRNLRPLAVTVQRWSVFANPRVIPGDYRADVAERVGRHLDVDSADVLRNISQVEFLRRAPDGGISRKPKYFTWIERRLERRDASDILSERLANGKPLSSIGFGIRPESKRLYPNDAMLCHVLGFVGIDGKGLDGMEAAYESVLAGVDGEQHVARDGRGRIMAGSALPGKAARDGRSIVLTIDRRIQRIVEEELKNLVEKHKPDSVCAVVMDPFTGDVLAMAGLPEFTPADPNRVRPEQRRNMAVVECLEPGSTFKPFVAAAALDLGLVTLDKEFFCHNGRWRTRGRRILRDSHAYGDLSVRDIVVFSSNIGMAQVGMAFTPEQLHGALRRFGFGRKTGIELAGETPGLLRPPNRWSPLSVASLSMGQEVACSPLQLTAAFCVFANGGIYVPPRIILGQTDADGRGAVTPAPVREGWRVISKATADAMRTDVLAGVVERGTAKRCKLKSYTMAGKTGTAQIARTTGGGYEPGAYTAGFVALAPVSEPRVVVAIFAKRPHGKSYYGGTVSAPSVAKIVERILSMHRIPRVTTCKAGPPATHGQEG
jgi:cell division protein FtsI (penicillin-binding protein 3)